MNVCRRLLLFSACAAFTLTACRTRTPGAEIPTGPQPFDQRFLTWLVSHHNDDDRMTGPCVAKGDIRKELHDFCATVDQQHRERVNRMKGWLKEWYNQEFPRTDDIPLWLGSLNGKEFEREFLTEYMANHADAVDPLTECVRKATHPELQDLCQRIAPRQKLGNWRDGAVNGFSSAIERTMFYRVTLIMAVTIAARTKIAPTITKAEAKYPPPEPREYTNAMPPIVVSKSPIRTSILGAIGRRSVISNIQGAVLAIYFLLHAYSIFLDGECKGRFADSNCPVSGNSAGLLRAALSHATAPPMCHCHTSP